jgi:hypothetical protein
MESACVAASREKAYADAMKAQGTEALHLDRKGFNEFLKRNDALNKQISADLGLLKRQ